ncbi:hypothetical protein Nepgr_010917 [Nepenthes gracilis]|uniref:Uncharacterized protein n=1 Tax=Nepenthes gracilis TaxID=150966 RepID=A0AAD3SEB6_NEPGR|nr:hypothetical protein Nepgr_010917 [Nepenthes gracilis]
MIKVRMVAELLEEYMAVMGRMMAELSAARPTHLDEIQRSTGSSSAGLLSPSTAIDSSNLCLLVRGFRRFADSSVSSSTCAFRTIFPKSIKVNKLGK